MLVNDIMQRDVVTVTPDTRLPQVLCLLQPRGFRHVPVIDNGALVGIISDRDVKQAMVSLAGAGPAGGFEHAGERLTAAEIMQGAVRTVGPMYTVEEAARLMTTQKISALPVTENSRLVGIVTETNVRAVRPGDGRARALEPPRRHPAESGGATRRARAHRGGNWSPDREPHDAGPAGGRAGGGAAGGDD
jgi:acetoin utilization protein AcuB